MSHLVCKRNIMEINQILLSIQQDILDIKRVIPLASQFNFIATDKWIRRADVMAYLNYGPTQMAALEKSGELIVSKVGKRKFILRTSLENYLERNIKTNL